MSSAVTVREFWATTALLEAETRGGNSGSEFHTSHSDAGQQLLSLTLVYHFDSELEESPAQDFFDTLES
jgi:hypothetical protein